MITKWLTCRSSEDLIRKVNEIKRSGVKCSTVEERNIVETATGRIVQKCYLIAFEGNFYQTLKARKIMDSFRNN